MAPIAKTLAIAATAFAALSAAAPGHNHGHKHNHKRDAVTIWETKTVVVWTTIDITTTVSAGQQAPPSTIIEESIDHATAPEPKPEPETTTTTTSTTTTTTSTTTAEPEPTSTVEPSIETPEVQVVKPTVSVPTEVPVPTQEPETTTEEPAPAETSTVDPVPSSGSGSGSGSGGPCSAGSPCVGQVTFYDTATSMSAPSSCGFVNDGSSENVIALPVGIMKDSDCGRTVVIKYNGKTSKGTVVDKCMGCDNTSIDLSRHFFSLLASFDAGRLHGVEWYLE